MELPPVSYAPRTRQRPLPIVLPVMAGIGIGVSTMFALGWSWFFLRNARHGVPTHYVDLLAVLVILASIASQILMGVTSLLLMQYRVATARRLRQLAWIAVGGLAVPVIAFTIAMLTVAEAWLVVLAAGVFVGITVVELVVPAFFITTLRQPKIIQAYEREARRRVALGELECQP